MAPGIPGVTPGIVALVPDVWGGPPMPRHQILTRLSRYMPVVWVDAVEPWQVQLRQSPISPADGYTVTDLAGTEAFHIYRPSRWLGEYYRPPWLSRMARRLRLSRALGILRKAGCTHPVLYLWRPEFGFALAERPWAMTLYHVDDDYSFSETETGIADDEFHVMRSVDQVIVHSTGLMERKGRINPRTALIPNGVNFDAFARAHPEPTDMAGIPHPRIGYVGVIKKQLDLDLLLGLARRHAAYSFVLVGPVQNCGTIDAEIEALRREPNVHFLGAKTPRELPAYTQHLDVGLLCYRVNDYTNCIYPLKLHEYLAAGLPTVSAPIATVREHASVVRLAHGPDDWSRALEESLSSRARSDDSVARRREVAGRHNWNDIAERIHALITEGLRRPAAMSGSVHCLSPEGLLPRA